MGVKLRYELPGAGWADCTIEIDGQAATMSASYLSDALDSLAQATVALLSGDQEATARFDEEPGEYRLRLYRLSAERIRLRILEFPELWGDRPDEEGKLLLEAECRLRTFAGAVLSELQRLRSQYGEEGYLELWIEHPFPSHRLDQLKRLLA